MKVLLIVILSFFALGYLLRFLAPVILRWYVRRMQKRFGFSNQGQQSARKEGDVTVNQRTSANASKKQNATKDVGDYVDFEEVK